VQYNTASYFSVGASNVEEAGETRETHLGS